MNVPDTLKALLAETKWSQRRLAERLGANQPDISRWLKGQEPRAQNVEAIRSLAREHGVLDVPVDHNYVLHVMGYVGAGGEIDPPGDSSLPYDGLEQITFPAPLGVLGDLVGYVVRGEAMMPRYSDGTIILVDRNPLLSGFDALANAEAVVSAGGKRYLRRIVPGMRPGRYRLTSINAEAIVTELDWASPVRVVAPGRSGAKSGISAARKERGDTASLLRQAFSELLTADDRVQRRALSALKAILHPGATKTS